MHFDILLSRSFFLAICRGNALEEPHRGLRAKYIYEHTIPDGEVVRFFSVVCCSSTLQLLVGRWVLYVSMYVIARSHKGINITTISNERV